jgi:hypothetical protein
MTEADTIPILAAIGAPIATLTILGGMGLFKAVQHARRRRRLAVVVETLRQIQSWGER